jgi:tetratricopeptide (TPR) repeat protein
MPTIVLCLRLRKLLPCLLGLPLFALTWLAMPSLAQDEQTQSVADAARAARARHAQQPGTSGSLGQHAPFSQTQLIAWQIAGVSAQDLVAEVKANGIAFSPDDAHLTSLKDAQIAPEILAALPAASSHPEASAGAIPQPLIAASQAHSAKDYAGARQALEPLAHQNKDADLYAALGNVLFLSNDLPAAKTAFESATQLDPTFLYAHLRLANIDYSLKNSEQTTAEARKILKLQPDNTEARRYLSLSLSMRLQGSDGGPAKKFEDLSDLASAAEDLSQETKDLNNQAIQLQQQGDYKGAEEAWNQAIKLNPKVALFYYSLANMYDEWGQHEALEYSNFLKAKALAPRNLAVRQNLGHYLCTYHKYNDAITEFREILEMDPDWNIARPCLYRALYATGKKNEAGRVIADYRFWNQAHGVPDDSDEIEVREPTIDGGRPRL